MTPLRSVLRVGIVLAWAAVFVALAVVLLQAVAAPAPTIIVY